MIIHTVLIMPGSVALDSNQKREDISRHTQWNKHGKVERIKHMS